jgi:hypothetical protein
MVVPSTLLGVAEHFVRLGDELEVLRSFADVGT